MNIFRSISALMSCALFIPLASGVEYRANHCEFWLNSISAVKDSVLQLQVTIEPQRINRFRQGENVIGFMGVEPKYDPELRGYIHRADVVTMQTIPYRPGTRFHTHLYLDLSKAPVLGYRGDLYLANLTTMQETAYYVYTTGREDLQNRVHFESTSGRSFSAGPFLVFDQKLRDSIKQRGGSVFTQNPDFKFYNPLNCQ